MTAIIDYGVGNLFSLTASFAAIGEEVKVTGDEKEILSADRIILPGVGAFGDAADKLRETGLDKTVKKAAQMGIPLMGICLGMQLLFEKSYEFGEHEGLGLLKGSVVGMDGRIDKSLNIPHIGWNALSIVNKDSQLFMNTKSGEFVYFVHSFYAIDCEDSLAAVTEYGEIMTAAVEKGKVFGCQFHPEKSSDAGLNILRAFCKVGAN